MSHITPHMVCHIWRCHTLHHTWYVAHYITHDMAHMMSPITSHMICHTRRCHTLTTHDVSHITSHMMMTPRHMVSGCLLSHKVCSNWYAILILCQLP